MAEYSIKELEKLSGVKAHTIRIWEKRYKLINPKRSATNIRCYSDSDLKKIMNVAIVNNSGVKISHIARLPLSELNKLVQQQSESGEELATPIDKLTIATIEMNERVFNKTLKKLETSMKFEAIVTEVLYPFLENIGILWQTGEITPAQEHFVSNLIRQKLFVAVDSLPLPSENSAKVVLFLPEGEYHEMGLLFYHYLARKKGYSTFYLGQSVPYSDLTKVVAVHKPKFLVTSFVTTFNDVNLQDLIRKLSSDFKKQTILISGMAALKSSPGGCKNVHQFRTSQELHSLL